ncbi:MAG: hypothetical protein IM531_16990, partial [Pseudanabaena sp. M090S1SP1A06QC]|nr:hypothetical protein [Pseudanabaena sp. M090S1SP1A06QC]
CHFYSLLEPYVIDVWSNTSGSGAVESSIKQIGRRIKISGAQWNQKNVPQVLTHRYAYLNGLLDSSIYNYSATK